MRKRLGILGVCAIAASFSEAGATELLKNSAFLEGARACASATEKILKSVGKRSAEVEAWLRDDTPPGRVALHKEAVALIDLYQSESGVPPEVHSVADFTRDPLQNYTILEGVGQFVFFDKGGAVCFPSGNSLPGFGRASDSKDLIDQFTSYSFHMPDGKYHLYSFKGDKKVMTESIGSRIDQKVLGISAENTPPSITKMFPTLSFESVACDHSAFEQRYLERVKRTNDYLARATSVLERFAKLDPSRYGIDVRDKLNTPPIPAQFAHYRKACVDSLFSQVKPQLAELEKKARSTLTVAESLMKVTDIGGKPKSKSSKPAAPSKKTTRPVF